MNEKTKKALEKARIKTTEELVEAVWKDYPMNRYMGQEEEEK